MNQYQLSRVIKRMEKRFGKFKQGEEEAYDMMFYSVESNILKMRRKYGLRSSALKDGLYLAFRSIEGILENDKEDLEDIETEDALWVKNAILMALDPLTNDQINKVLSKDHDLNDPGYLEEYYKIPVRVLLRLDKSIDLWNKRGGSNGYFNMLEDFIGNRVADDEKMEFAISLESEE